MKKRIGVIAIALLVCVAFAASAQVKKSDKVPWLVAYNAPGSTNISIGGGWTSYGFGVMGAFNHTLGQFDLGPIPLTYGLTVAADAGFSYGVGLGAGAFFTVDGGVDWGGIAKFEWRVGLGAGATFALSNLYATSPFGIGIGQYFSWTWWFSKSFGFTVQEMYAYTFMGPNLDAYTAGVELKL